MSTQRQVAMELNLKQVDTFREPFHGRAPLDDCGGTSSTKSHCKDRICFEQRAS